MAPSLMRLVFIAVSLLLSTASAGRMSERSRRRGFTEAFVNDLNSRENGRLQARSTSKFRFLNNDTKAYRVESMPDIPFDVGEMYSGLIPIDMNNASRALFFVFQPTIGQPVDEITIWLNGGPGCSSLEGFLQENGLFQWTWGQYSPVINDYSWVNLTNVLWVEQPVGTGFAIGDVTATSEYDVSRDFVNFFENFQEIFGVKKFKIFVTGESYAGEYVPYIAAEMIDRNAQKSAELDVGGILIYDPCIGSFSYTQNQAVAVPWVQENNNIIGLNSSFMSYLEKQDKTCGYAAYRNKYLTFPSGGQQAPEYFNSTSEAECDLWGLIYNTAYHTNPCFNPYEPNLQCPLLSDPLGFPTDLQYTSQGLPVYFNRTDVKKAMHAPLNVTWVECAASPVFVGGKGGPEDEGDHAPDPIQSALPKVIEHTNRVLVANGALDFEIITNGTLIAIQNMTWNGTRGFESAPSRPIVITEPDLEYGDLFEQDGWGKGFEDPMGTMGVQHYERGLMFAETNLCGHMQPQFQPRVSYRHLEWLLGKVEVL